MNIVVVKEMKGYFKELNEKGELISICHKNKKYENDGICYFYSNGIINKVSKWKDGKEISIIKKFDGLTMSEFVNGIMIYKGGYLNNIESDYARHGMGEEYGRKGKIVYEGEYDNGKRPSNMELCCKHSCKCLGDICSKCCNCCCNTCIICCDIFGYFLFSILSLLWLFSMIVIGASISVVLFLVLGVIEVILMVISFCIKSCCDRCDRYDRCRDCELWTNYKYGLIMMMICVVVNTIICIIILPIL